MKVRDIRILSAICGLLLAGCGRVTPPAVLAPSPPLDLEEASAMTASSTTATLPLALGREQLPPRIIDSLRKRIMGRRASLPDIERIVKEISPLLAAAARQPAAEKTLRRIARDSGLSLEAARARWIALHEADILLESGGNPDAVSVSEAVGIAQWLAGTGRRAGLSIHLAESKRLTRKIDDLKRRIAWLEYLLRPDADPNAPGAPKITRAEARTKLPTLRQELEKLRAKRRRVDQRYDPQKALFAQTRYLMRLYARFPGFDWVFQAYHGGEAGVQRTLKKYLGRAWPGSAAVAIRRGRAGKPLRYEHLYLATRPRTHPAAFGYLYGRSDDHRYYWWKLRAAQEAIALYRRDPAAFRRAWESLLPGRAKEAYWYPDAPNEAMADLPALEAACREQRSVPIGDRAEYVVPNTPSPLHATLRPEAKGALILVATAYRRAGGSGRLTVGDLTLTQADLDRAKALRPPVVTGPLWPPDPDAGKRPGGGPPPDFDFHVTGFAFDILTPSNARQRKILEYALGYFADREILWWMDEARYGPRRYHVVPNPRYAAALASIGTNERAPELRGL